MLTEKVNIPEVGELEPSDPKLLEVIRHSTAHLMAMAITELFPGTKLAIGPVIENGFYYDLESTHTFTPEDFSSIEKKMKEHAKKKYPIVREMHDRLKLIEDFKTVQETYKVELLEGWVDQEVSMYRQGPFADLCRGPHVPHTGLLFHHKLLSVAGAYWRGDEKRPMLQRIYGTAFATSEALDKHLTMLEEAKRRDHRLIGRELDYFHIDEGSPGMVFWHPKGWKMYRTLENYITQKIEKNGYVLVKTPEVVDQELFRKSGHLDNYTENMFLTQSEKRGYVIKPMNCPCHIEIFKKGIKSFRDLPLRIAEFGKCHRNELAGTMHGLMRVRGFVQDDAHIFCTEEQVSEEVSKFCLLLKDIYQDFGFTDILVKFSDRPEKRLGADDVWDRAENALRIACENSKLKYELNPGEGAFYGPKLEFVLKDSLGRNWQCGTIQVDFQLPERLGAVYIDENSDRKAPVMLHRAILGSLERFIGILLENFAGDLPLWINPVSARICPISEKFMDYAESVKQTLEEEGFSIELDQRNEKIGKKIRDGEKSKVPYLIIIGEKEVTEQKVSIRKRKIGDLGAFSVDEILKKFKLESQSKGISPVGA